MLAKQRQRRPSEEEPRMSRLRPWFGCGRLRMTSDVYSGSRLLYDRNENVCFEVLILSVALTRKKRGLLGSSDLEMRVEWLMRFREIKSGVPMRESHVLETHLNRIRDFGGRRESMFITTSSGR